MSDIDPNWTFDEYRFDGVEHGVMRTGPGAELSIPTDPSNADYQNYLAWKELGGIPTVIDLIAPPVVPPVKIEDVLDQADTGIKINALLAALRELRIIR
jgi:hypothetical protein